MRDVWYLVTNPDESLCLAKGQEDIETVVQLVPRIQHQRMWCFDKKAWEYTKLMALIHFLSMFVFLNDVVQVISFVLSVVVVCTDNNKYTMPYLCVHLVFSVTGIPTSVISKNVYDMCISCMYAFGYSVLMIFYMRLE